MAWTQTKRMSVQGYTSGLMRPKADATINVGDRAHVAWLFSADSYPGLPATPDAPANQVKHTTQRVFAHRGFEYWREAWA